MVAAGGWSDLPSELLADIAGDLTDLADLSRFRSVCSTWRAAAAEAAAAPPPQPPWLLLPSSLFFSLPENRLYSHLLLPAASRRRRRLFASPHGWALSVDPSLSASLLHPFTGATIPLPSLPSFFAETDDLAWDWSPHGVMASCGEGLLFSSVGGGGAWKPIAPMSDSTASSINYRDGAFFVFEEDICRTTVMDAASLTILAIVPPPTVELPAEARLVVAGDDLILLVKSKWMYIFGNDQVEFSRAFRADHRSAEPVWSEITSVGDRALFVDSFHGFAVDTNVFKALRRNCVYSVTAKGPSDRSRRAATVKYAVSMFDLEERCSERLVCRLDGLEIASRGESPSWIIPSW